ncbi:MAG: hypothetical protein ABH874_00550 [Methanobacteriota archaeon]
MSDWLAFLETRSSNYIAAMALGASILAITAVALSFLGEDIQQLVGLPGLAILFILLGIALLIILLTDKLAGASLAVDASEAKRISDMITEGRKIKTVEDVKREWKNRAKSLRQLIEKRKQLRN